MSDKKGKHKKTDKEFRQEEKKKTSDDYLKKYKPAIKVVENSNKVTEEVKKEFPSLVKKVVARKQWIEAHVGPIPAPRVLREYQNCGEDVKKYILKRAAVEQKHRHEMESIQVNSFASSIKYNDETTRILAKRGQTFACIISLAFIIAGTVLLIFDKKIEGITALGIPVLAIIAYFIKGLFKKDRNESDKK